MVSWAAPDLRTVNGEFLGYILTLRPVSGPGAGDRTSIEVRDESFKTQVNTAVITLTNGNHLIGTIHRTIR